METYKIDPEAHKTFIKKQLMKSFLIFSIYPVIFIKIYVNSKSKNLEVDNWIIPATILFFLLLFTVFQVVKTKKKLEASGAVFRMKMEGT